VTRPHGHRTRWRARLCGVALVVAVGAGPALAQDQYTLLVTGASGGEKFKALHDQSRTALITGLRNLPGFDDDHLIVLAETPGPGVGRASREGVGRAIDTLAAQMDEDAVLHVVLIGHGSFDGVDAKFNLVGPDLEAAEWDTLLSRLPGRLVFVNTTSASSPFLERLAGRGRTIVTATESPAQRFDTVFPRFFAEAFSDLAADANKDDRVSVLEAFDFASLGVRRWYQQRGQLATERALIDDNGDGRGRETGQPGPDGLAAARLFLGAGREEAELVTDPALVPLVARRRELQQAVADLKAAKTDLTTEAYFRDLERLLTDLARVSRQIRRASSSG
jgi:chorismate mutase